MGYSGAILKNCEGRMLFQLRDGHGRNPNKLGIFGGGIKRGEQPLQALVREIKEELGIDILKSSLLREYKIPLIKYHIFEIQLRSSQEHFRLGEGKDMKFMTLKEFLKTKNALLRVKLFLLFLWLFS